MKSDFNPNGYAIHNDNFIGLPFDEKSAKIVLLPVPWEATVSYSAGTAQAATNILEASYQLDLLDWDYPNAWQFGIYMRPIDTQILALSNQTRELAKKHIDALENQTPIDTQRLDIINKASLQVNDWVYTQCKSILNQNKLIGLIGGEHSIPFGCIRALAERHNNFGILQLDAHCDLRQAYEGFEHSHASIYYNVLEKIPAVSKLIQVGIRDACEDEINYATNSNNRIEIYSMPHIRALGYQQKQSYHEICLEIINKLPQKVYISFDIDGLDPKLCPNTGTPVPDGLEMNEAFYLINQIVQSGRQIIGFDLSEVGTASEWDGNVGARVLYKLANACCASQDK